MPSSDRQAGATPTNRTRAARNSPSCEASSIARASSTFTGLRLRCGKDAYRARPTSSSSASTGIARKATPPARYPEVDARAGDVRQAGMSLLPAGARRPQRRGSQMGRARRDRQPRVARRVDGALAQQRRGADHRGARRRDGGLARQGLTRSLAAAGRSPSMAPPMRYPVESFSEEERALLAPHFTNLDRPVFALVNLPETVKGALFARYSRYPGTLRRLFLDEFAGDLEGAVARAFDGDEGERAARLYRTIFLGYGDDSVAQLGGAHVACEW